jgi:hypothetical protein
LFDNNSKLARKENGGYSPESSFIEDPESPMPLDLDKLVMIPKDTIPLLGD